jgi:AraC-like DNA-binding protein
VDALTDVLAVAAVEGSVAASLIAGGTWGLRLDAVPGAAFHAIAAGTAVLLVDGHPPLTLSPGDVVLLPGGIPHTLAASTDAPARPFDHVRAETSMGAGGELRIGEGQASTRILCASYRHDPAAALATFSLLPPVLHVPALDAPPALRSCLQLLADELGHPGPGSRTVLDHVVNVLLIQLLRTWILNGDGTQRPPSWLRGLSEPITRAALTELHQNPRRPWTVDVLARRVGVSRSTLNRRFRTEIGRSPTDYLTTWRMELAAFRLRSADEPVAAVAHSVGYTSEYAFNRAFARSHGLPPGRYRTAARSAGTTDSTGNGAPVADRRRSS